MDSAREISEVGARLRARERPARGGFRRLLAPFGLRRSAPGRDEEVMALLRLIWGGSEDLPRLEGELTAALGEARGLGVPPNSLRALAQAYSRAVARIVEAEAETVHAFLVDVPEDVRARRLDQLLAAALPASSATFDLLHAALLRDALGEALTPESLAETATAPSGIALVDLVGSTTFLETATTEETTALVDTLFDAGQLATANRTVRPLKYVGDGVFLAGRDAQQVALAALDAVDHIAWASPIPARAGFAYGPAVRRAGDYFGLPMNLAQLLTKVAEPGTLLATEEAAAELPPEMVTRRGMARVGRTRRVRVHKIERP